MTTPLEVAANALNAVSVLLAGRNNVHTWWLGIAGSVLFAWLCYSARLYADALLQLFFIATSVSGWRHWARGRDGAARPVRRTRPAHLAALALGGLIVAALHGSLLLHFTDAYAPFPDSVVLTFSVIGQFLLVGRRVESWWCWLLVDTLAVPLFFSRGLQLTALLYVAFWCNAVVSLRRWQRLVREQ